VIRHYVAIRAGEHESIVREETRRVVFWPFESLSSPVYVPSQREERERVQLGGRASTVRLRAARVSSRRSGCESGGAILANETTKLEPIRLQQERGTTEGKGKEERMSNRGEGRSFLFGFFVFQPQERHAVELSSRASQNHFDEAAEGRGARVASALRNVGQILQR
jgi:hypothetical protein